ncbi:glycosyltransferase family 4 protein [Blautia sp.]
MKIVMLGHKRIPSREGGIEVVIEELATRMVKQGHSVTCFNRKGNHINGRKVEKLNVYKGVEIKEVFTLNKKGLAVFSSSLFASLRAGIGNYEIIHVHAEGPAFFSFIPHFLEKKVIVTVHGECEIIWTTREKPDFMRVYAA